MDGAHTKTQGGIYPTTPPAFALSYTYDKESNRTAAYDSRPGAQQNLSYEYDYDELDRLKEAVKGNGPSGSFTAAAGGERWNLDMLGNWSEKVTDTAGTFGVFDGSDTDEDREHNSVNELYDIDGNLLEYDHSGNLRHRFVNADDGYRYMHDAWNRLVKVEYVEDIGGTEVVTVLGEYAYNGLHQRTIHRLDTNDPPDGSLDQQRFMYYDASWRLIEEEIWDGWSSGTPGSIDRHIHYTWGARYIDDLAFRRVDNNGNGDYTDGGDKTYYHITDAQFSTRMILDPSAAIVEWVDYTPYGEARHHHKYDIDGDGDFDSADRSIVTTLADLAGFPPDPTDIDELGYRAEADINRDGTIDGSDVTAIGTSYTSAISSGLISTSGGACDNIIGYDGYVFNAETMQYSVRYRTYDPGLGRWLRRDPAEYYSSLNLFEYSWSKPVDFADPSGLDPSFVPGLRPFRIPTEPNPFLEPAYPFHRQPLPPAPLLLPDDYQKLLKALQDKCAEYKTTADELGITPCRGEGDEGCTYQKCLKEAEEIAKLYHDHIEGVKWAMETQNARGLHCVEHTERIRDRFYRPRDGSENGKRFDCWEAADFRDFANEHSWVAIGHCEDLDDRGYVNPGFWLDPWRYWRSTPAPRWGVGGARKPGRKHPGGDGHPNPISPDPVECVGCK